MANKRPRAIVLGIGNPDRGDDAAGQAVVRLLRDVLPGNIEVAEHDAEATALVWRLSDFPEAFLVDASACGAPCGTVQRFDLSTAPLPQGAAGLSTHSFGLAEVIELGRALGQLPPRCIVYAIEGCAFRMGEPMSPPVVAAVADVVARLRAEIQGETGLGREKAGRR